MGVGDFTSSYGVEGIITTDFDIAAWGILGATLSDNDLSDLDGLAVVNFDAQALTGAIAAQSCRATSFLMSHRVLLANKC